MLITEIDKQRTVPQVYAMYILSRGPSGSTKNDILFPLVGGGWEIEFLQRMAVSHLRGELITGYEYSGENDSLGLYA